MKNEILSISIQMAPIKERKTTVNGEMEKEGIYLLMVQM